MQQKSAAGTAGGWWKSGVSRHVPGEKSAARAPFAQFQTPSLRGKRASNSRLGGPGSATEWRSNPPDPPENRTAPVCMAVRGSAIFGLSPSITTRQTIWRDRNRRCHGFRRLMLGRRGLAPGGASRAHRRACPGSHAQTAGNPAQQALPGSVVCRAYAENAWWRSQTESSRSSGANTQRRHAPRPLFNGAAK